MNENPEIAHIPHELLEKLCSFIEEKTGLYFPEKRYQEVNTKLLRFFKESEFKNPIEGAKWLLAHKMSKKTLSSLASCLTVGETYFFRDPHFFLLLEKEILPALIALKQSQNKCLNIWCVGCSTGEEPYSIAILLYRLLRRLEEWSISILATDINLQFLEKASQATYKKWSFRSTEPQLKKYFIQSKDHLFTPIEPIKQMVQFEQRNVLEELPSMSMDLIICRNMLIYFSSKQAQNVVTRLTDNLKPLGLLCVNAIETSFVQDTRLTLVYEDEGIYRRN